MKYVDIQDDNLKDFFEETDLATISETGLLTYVAIDKNNNISKKEVKVEKDGEEDVVHYGVMHGKWENKEETILKLDQIKEKPSVDYAEDYLSVKANRENENYYAVFGQYVLTKDVFDVLKHDIDNNNLEDGEIQLTSALETVRNSHGMIGCLINGKSYDIGLPDKYYKTMVNYKK